MRMLMDGLCKAGIECGVRSRLWNESVESPDLIHCHDAGSHTFARRPFVVSRRVGFPVKSGLLSRWKYSRASAYLAISNYTAQKLREVDVPDEKIFIVPDAVAPMPHADRSTKRVLLLSKNGQTVPGAIPVRDLITDLTECDVFVYLSDMEGLGSAALAAQAAGVPVVASASGGLPEAVKFGRLIHDIGEAKEAVEAARSITVDVETIMSEFGIPRMVERTIAVYRKVLNAD